VTVLVVLETAVLAVLVVLVSGLLRSHATILRRLHELGVDTAERRPNPRSRPLPAPPGPTAGRLASLLAPDVCGVGLDGSAVAIRVAEVEADTLLVFLSSGCSTCGALWEAMADPDLALPQGTRPVVVAQGAAREHVGLLAELAPLHLPLVLSTQAWEDYAVPGAPYAVLVDGASGRVAAEGSAPTFGEVLALLGRPVDETYTGSCQDS